MSVQALSWVFEHSTAVGAARLVLLSIANHVGPSGEGWVYVGQVLQEANVSEDTYARAVKWAEGAGELRRDVNGGGTLRTVEGRRPNLFLFPAMTPPQRAGGSFRRAVAATPPQGAGVSTPPQPAGPTPPQDAGAPLYEEPSKEPSPPPPTPNANDGGGRTSFGTESGTPPHRERHDRRTLPAVELVRRWQVAMFGAAPALAPRPSALRVAFEVAKRMPAEERGQDTAFRLCVAECKRRRIDTFAGSSNSWDHAFAALAAEQSRQDRADRLAAEQALLLRCRETAAAVTERSAQRGAELLAALPDGERAAVLAARGWRHGNPANPLIERLAGIALADAESSRACA